MTDLKYSATQAMLAVYEQNDQLHARVKALEALQGDQELWCVLIQGTGETLAMKSKDAAEQRADELNALGLEGMAASVMASPWPQDIHFAKAFAILEAWLHAANHALNARSGEVVTLRSMLASWTITCVRSPSW